MSDRYILDGKTPIRCGDFIKWARWYETADCRVAQDVIGGVRISTVFLSISHQWGDGPPILFETMIFGGPHSDYMTRCSTWDEAEAMHAVAVKLVQSTPFLTKMRAAIVDLPSKLKVLRWHITQRLKN